MQEYIVRQHSVSSFAANWLCNKLSLSHVCFASSAINGDHQRRRRDLNPRAAINDLHPFQGCPFGQLGYFSEYITRYLIRSLKISNSIVFLMSGEDGIRTHVPLRTNGFQDRLVMTTSIPLLIRFLSLTAYASASAARHIISLFLFNVNNFFYFFQKSCLLPF